MNLDRLIAFAVAVVIGAAACGKIDTLQRWIWTAQAKVIVEFRTSDWGSPKFWPSRDLQKSFGNRH